MVKRPQQKYDILFRELHTQAVDNNPNSANDYVNSVNCNDDMKNELKRYLMDLNSSSQPQFPQPQFPQPQSDFIELGSTYQ